MKLIFAVLDVSLTMGLTGCYKTGGFLHLLLLNDSCSQLMTIYLDLNLDPANPTAVLDDETFPLTPITGHSVNTTPADLHLL